MKRSEWFVTKGKGHWAKARAKAKCERGTVMGPCGNAIMPGDVYLLTDLPVFPDSVPEDKRRWIMKKYCFKCADAELPV